MGPVENQPQTPSLTLGSVWISIRTGPVFLYRSPKLRKRHERNSISVKQTICRFFAGFLRQKRGGTPEAAMLPVPTNMSLVAVTAAPDSSLSADTHILSTSFMCI